MTSINNNNKVKLDECFPASVREHIYATQGEDSKWGRLVLTWNEQLLDGNTKVHKYAAIVNRETGGLYLDCRPQKILAKCFATTLGHPISTICKLGRDWAKICTETHRKLNPMKKVPVSAPSSNTNGIEASAGSTKLVPDKKPPLLERVKIVGNCIKDLFRDAGRAFLYGMALQIISFVGTIVGTLAIITKAKWLENRLYDLRELSGKTEKAFQRDETGWTLAPCFQAIDSIKTMGSYKSYHKLRNDEWDSADFIKQYGQDESMRALNRWARNQLDFRRKNCGPFNDSCMKLNNKVTYLSKAYDNMKEIMYAKAIKPLLIDPSEQQALHEKAAAWSKI